MGGLIGSADSTVSSSYATGSVVGDINNSSAGNDNLGGLVGYQYSGSVIKSMALGNVSGTTKLGGLVGRFDGTSIKQSYANGNVTGNYAGDPANEVGNYYIGGLVGYARGSFTETYSSGVVKGIAGGCIVGYVNGSLTISKSYFDKTKCNLGVDGGEDAVSIIGDPAKTSFEMQTQETFENWDFIETWMIFENTYPFLQIYTNPLVNAEVTTESLEGYVYDGSVKTPLVTSVKLFGEILSYETEYTISYKNNLNAGIAFIYVCGVQPYYGCKEINYEIARKPIELTVASIENKEYSGTALRPKLLVYNGDVLLADSVYSVEYKDNINAGIASVTVSMKGNYSGLYTTTFKIDKKTPIIITPPKASDIVLGNTLKSSVLSGAIMDIEGEFLWKNPEIIPDLNNDGYAAVFVPTDSMNYTHSLEVIVPLKVLDMVDVLVHSETATLDSIVILKGSNYTLPDIPDSTGYNFLGFFINETNVGHPGDQILINKSTVIKAKYEIKTFVISFMNEGIELKSNEISYGTLPIAPEIVLPPNTAQFSYIFSGWDKDLVPVTESVVYTAIIDTIVNQYDVIFKKNSTIIQSESLNYGTLPIAPEIVLPPNTAQFSYNFSGWDKELVPVTESVVYTAIIDSVLNKYRVVFKNDNGVTLNDSMYVFGTLSSQIIKPLNPTREATEKYTYIFKEWGPTIADVTENMVYVASFDSTIRNYNIVFMNGFDTLQSEKIDYGVTPIYTGNAPTKKSSATHNYEFVGWSPEIGPTTKDINYIAVFDSSTLSGIKDNPFASFGVSVKEHSRYIQINNAKVGSLYTILDVQGCVVKKGLVGSSSFNITIPQSGHYLIKIGSQTRRVNIK